MNLTHKNEYPYVLDHQINASIDGTRKESNISSLTVYLVDKFWQTMCRQCVVAYYFQWLSLEGHYCVNLDINQTQ